MLDRRELMMMAAGTLVAGRAGAQEAQPAGEARFFPGFKPFKVKTTGAAKEAYGRKLTQETPS